MKVVSVGCSFTAGVGVEHSQNYTTKLAEKLNCQFENYGEAGHSNQYIFRKTIELLKNWNSDDILIVQWTSPFREEIITNEGYLFYPPWSNWFSLSFLYGKNPMPGLEAVGIFDKDAFEKQIIKDKQIKVIDYCENFYNEKYLEDLSFSFQLSLYGLLENMGIKYIMFFGWEFQKIFENQKEIFKYTNEKFLKETFGSFTNTTNNEHPDTDGHLKWTNYLYQKLIELKYI